VISLARITLKIKRPPTRIAIEIEKPFTAAIKIEGPFVTAIKVKKSSAVSHVLTLYATVIAPLSRIKMDFEGPYAVILFKGTIAPFAYITIEIN
jgi:hypothetical protein